MSERPHKESHSPTLSRRSFLKGLGTAVVATAAAPATKVAAEVGDLQKLGKAKTLGPGPVPITLDVNGKQLKLNVEPRVTLLDALRNHANLTGAKEVCDRATCGACTVLFDGQPIYSCMKLAVEAQGHTITTIEGLSEGGKLTAVQQAFIESDASMCGYCTPGLVMSVTALLQRNPHPTADEVRTACSGNLCRCGVQARVLNAALKAGGVNVANRTEVIRHA
ncbi:MAG TPA: (2Fe-2S)-binding protein [Verrucomicrobiae bacterium]|nr:(2Fe-2S)-binding protein [Verrucomicrobiae bacterium]